MTSSKCFDCGVYLSTVHFVRRKRPMIIAPQDHLCERCWRIDTDKFLVTMTGVSR